MFVNYVRVVYYFCKVGNLWMVSLGEYLFKGKIGIVNIVVF